MLLGAGVHFFLLPMLLTHTKTLAVIMSDPSCTKSDSLISPLTEPDLLTARGNLQRVPSSL